MEDNFQYIVCPECWFEECEEYTYPTYISRECLSCGYEEIEEKKEKQDQ